MDYLVVCCVVSERIYKEFTYLKYSIERYHNIKWILSVDSYVYDIYKDELDMDLHLLIGDSGTFIFNSTKMSIDERRTSKDNYRALVQTKLDIMLLSISTYGYCFLLDADMVFVNEIPQSFLNSLYHKEFDIALSIQDQPEEDDIMYGKYNAGMVGATNIDLINDWRLVIDSNQYYFYEQKPLSVVLESGDYIISELDYGMNVAFWKLDDINDLCINDSTIYINNSKVINLHYHFDASVAIHGTTHIDYILSIINLTDTDLYTMLRGRLYE